MGKIVVNLDVEMAKRKISLGELAERVGLTQANLSILKTGKARAVRPLQHARGYLPRAGMSARRHTGI